ncbi:DUF2501 domain-containing protein [Cupriavidus sp. IDO]|uniref:DUF2501 domain-containing protein n=1 Tax=Cupriavidus sp. IDO TaxID=1539142 RepID=UPI000578FB99|nr:DUF2501 domain-containing protein [Cupriavidus sp. IDO]KWR90264.1 hypothetical protein RM96_10285 [Cupriavidus sp. IDO]
MKSFRTSHVLWHRCGVLAFVAATLLHASATQAQLGDILKNPMGGAGGVESATGNLGGLSLQSLTSGSAGNVAGVLDFCIKNNYLGAHSAGSVKDKLMDKLGGPASVSNDSGYTSGAKGVLQSGNGKTLDLSGSGLKAKATEQVCEKILAQGKSLL